MSLKERVDKKTMRNLLQRIEKRIEASFPQNMVEMVAPLTATEGVEHGDGIYRLLKRLIAAIESSWCQETLSSLVDFYFAAACHVSFFFFLEQTTFLEAHRQSLGPGHDSAKFR